MQMSLYILGTDTTEFQRQQATTEIKVRAERKCGEMLRDSAERGERATQKHGGANIATASNDATPSAPTLADIGITRDQSSRYQQLAATPDEHFETASLSQTGGGKFSDTPATGGSQRNGVQVGHHRDDGMRPRRTPCSASSQQQAAPSSEFRPKSGHVPAQPGTTEPPETGFSATTTASMYTAGGARTRNHPAPAYPANGGSVSGAWPAKPPTVDGDYLRQRDNERPADTWCSDLGEFRTASSTANRHLYCARASPASVASDSIHELLAPPSTTE